ncbi:hypothetical protein B0H14DRAFT_2595839 [Mycena olivaceomarginata]|nr:hypothetical protein B0H14DRAFT_2595839 [Mycena olivaceomarginata]
MSSFILFSIALNLHWNPLAQDCWYSNENQKERLAWQIGTQLFWTLLTVAGEVSAALAVIIYIVRHQLRNREYLATGTGSRMRLHSSSAVAVNDRVIDATVYRSVIFRIVIYPVVSAIINLTSVVCVIHITQYGVHNWTGYSVLLVGDFVYGGRAVLYALLAATDPNDNGTSMDRVDGASTKYPGTSHSHEDYDDFKMGPRPDVEEGPQNHDDLQGLQSAGVDALGNRRHIWLQEDMIRRREEMLARDRDRQEFQKQI